MIALAAGIAAGVYVWWYYARVAPAAWSDFDQIWIGARAVVAGENPYVAVRSSFAWPLFYPLPALLLALPVAAIPLSWARVMFAAVTASCTTWGILRHRPHLWPGLCSFPFLLALQRGQWVPLILLAALAPSRLTGPLLAIKPNVSLPIIAFRPSRSALVGALGCGLVSLLVMPSWPLAWLREIQHTPHIHPPVLMPGGLLLLAAFLRWREPGARLLGVSILVPQTRALYELFPLLLAARTRRGAAGLVLAWNVLSLVIRQHYAPSSLQPMIGGTYDPSAFDASWVPILLLGYLPVLWLLVLPAPQTARRAVVIGWRAGLGVLAIVTLAIAGFVWRVRGMY